MLHIICCFFPPVQGCQLQNIFPHRFKLCESRFQTGNNILIPKEMFLYHWQLFLDNRSRIPRVGNSFRRYFRIRISNCTINSLLHPLKIGIHNICAVIYDKRPLIKGFYLSAQPRQVSYADSTARNKQYKQYCI